MTENSSEKLPGSIKREDETYNYIFSPFHYSRKHVLVKDEPLDGISPRKKRIKLSQTLPLIYGNILCPKHHKKAKPVEIKVETNNDNIESTSTERKYKNFKRRIVFDLETSDNKSVCDERNKSEINNSSFEHRKNKNKFYYRYNRKKYGTAAKGYHHKDEFWVRVPAHMANRVRILPPRNNQHKRYREKSNFDRSWFHNIHRKNRSSSPESSESSFQSNASSHKPSNLNRLVGFTGPIIKTSNSTECIATASTSSSASLCKSSKTAEFREIKVVGFCCMVCEKEKNIEVVDIEENLVSEDIINSNEDISNQSEKQVDSIDENPSNKTDKSKEAEKDASNENIDCELNDNIVNCEDDKDVDGEGEDNNSVNDDDNVISDDDECLIILTRSGGKSPVDNSEVNQIDEDDDDDDVILTWDGNVSDAEVDAHEQTNHEDGDSWVLIDE